MSREPVHPSRGLKFWLAGSAGAALCFLLGTLVGHYRWPPFELMSRAKAATTAWLGTSGDGQLDPERELMKSAFIDPVVDPAPYYPAISDISGIRQANQRILVPREGFERAYETLVVEQAEQLARPSDAPPVVRVRFRYDGRPHEAFAYGVLPGAEQTQGWGALVIPGSGMNVSTALWRRQDAPETAGRHLLGCLEVLRPNAFVLIKPNEDFLAWHDGHNRKLGGDFIWAWQLNRGGSYSVSYLLQAMAFSKWLKASHESTAIAGASQGGLATALVGIQSRPNAVIVVSGLSTVAAAVEPAGPNQLIGVPGLADLYLPDQLAAAVRASGASWYLSWGLKEEGSYRLDAKSGLTKAALSEVPGATAIIHGGGHHADAESLEHWLRSVAGGQPRATDR